MVGAGRIELLGTTLIKPTVLQTTLRINPHTIKYTKEDSNFWPPLLTRGALPTELLAYKTGAIEGTWTPNFLFDRQAL